MHVARSRLASGAAGAQGTAVIIDVFRAFTCAPLFFHLGAERVILEPDPEKATAMRRGNPDWILVGEVNEVPLEAADAGNSPSEILRLGGRVFGGKTVVHRTTAGVTGAETALGPADEVLLGGFVTAKATVRHIKSKDPQIVTLVAMGDRAQTEAPEDEACADYLEHLLISSFFDPVAALSRVLFQATARKFLYRERPHLPPEDPALCLQRDLFDFALAARKKEGVIEAVMIRAVDEPYSSP
ncbi:MAG: 2-phosphosulfolactate phosphatase [Desulfobacteraceae bacterium]